MRRLRLNLLLLHLFILPIWLTPNAYCYWGGPASSEAVSTGLISVGKWKDIIILEEEGVVLIPKEGDEIVFQGQLYVVLEDADFSIINDISWWGWNNPWSRVNLVTSEWSSSNYYDQKSMPILKDDKYYLAFDSGATNHIPGLHSSWFELSLNYLPSNIYLKGYIVSHCGSDENPRYWISKQYVNQHIPPGEYAWAWDEILPWSGGAEPNQLVYNIDLDGNVHFWEALKATNKEPNVESARSGDYQEIKNGWISPLEDAIINFWVEHNVYYPGDVISYGVDNSLRYRYFRCIKTSVEEAPFLIAGGKEVFNHEYWEEIF